MASVPFSHTPLSVAHDETYWAWHRWPEFAAWPEPEKALVIVPLAGLADWGLGHGLDAEEIVLSHLLRGALELAPPAPHRLLVTPPLRFVFAPDESAAFALDPPTFHALLEEIAVSIKASGFRRILLMNASPTNDALTAAAARDLRIDHALQIFRICLSGLGLDFDPVRNPDRRALQTLLTALTGQPPRGSAADGAVPLAEATAAAQPTFTTATRQLADLLAEIHAWPPLPDDGRIPAASLAHLSTEA